mmetsp:Transcript_13412/g.28621  ORF Transcript_13412/g.28621 Transcript_13412/m.28621 type:complete len:117 (+) Transcript_13412:140-490(+)
MLFHYRPDTWTSFGISLNIYGLLVFHRVSQPIWNAKVMMKNRMKRMIPKSLTDFHCHRMPSLRFAISQITTTRKSPTRPNNSANPPKQKNDRRSRARSSKVTATHTRRGGRSLQIV